MHRNAITRAARIGAATASLLLLAVPNALAANLKVAPSGSDQSSCTPSAPCRSLTRAYSVASAGETVEVASGTYGSQTIEGDSSRHIQVRAAPGARPVFSGLDVTDTSDVTVAGIQTGYVDIQNASDVTVRDGEGPGLFIGRNTRNIQIIGGSYGGGPADTSPVKIQGSPPPTDILLDGVIFHDAIRQTEGAHLECVYAADIQGFTVRRSQFRNCAIMDLFITKLSGMNPRDVLIENNFFDRTGSHANSLSKGYYSLMVANHLDSAVNYTIRNNSFGQSMSLDAGQMVNTRVVGNVGPLAACRRGVTFAHNVWSDQRCGSTDRQAPSRFVDPGSYNYHLAPGSPAIDAGDPSEAPAVDIDGQARPAGGAPDAGADEFGASAPGAGGPKKGGRPAKRRATKVTLRVKRVRGHRATWRAWGKVKGASGGKVTVLVKRRSHGRWRTTVVRHLKLHHKRYATRFTRRKAGPYRIIARYSGSAAAAPSRSKRHVLR